jgi:hypothetical protein
VAGTNKPVRDRDHTGAQRDPLAATLTVSALAALDARIERIVTTVLGELLPAQLAHQRLSPWLDTAAAADY